MVWRRNQFRCPAIHGETVPATSQPRPSGGQPGLKPVAPPVGGLGRLHQRFAQFAQFGSTRALVERGGDVLGGASHLIDAIGQVGRIVGRQHHRIGRQGRRPVTPLIEARCS